MASFEDNLATIRHHSLQARDEALFARTHAGQIRDDALIALKRNLAIVNAAMAEIEASALFPAAARSQRQQPAVHTETPRKVVPILGRMDIKS